MRTINSNIFCLLLIISMFYECVKAVNEWENPANLLVAKFSSAHESWLTLWMRCRWTRSRSSADAETELWVEWLTRTSTASGDAQAPKIAPFIRAVQLPAVRKAPSNRWPLDTSSQPEAQVVRTTACVRYWTCSQCMQRTPVYTTWTTAEMALKQNHVQGGPKSN